MCCLIMMGNITNFSLVKSVCFSSLIHSSPNELKIYTSGISPALPGLTPIPGPRILPYTDRDQITTGFYCCGNSSCYSLMVFVICFSHLSHLLYCTLPSSISPRSPEKPCQWGVMVVTMKDLMMPATMIISTAWASMAAYLVLHLTSVSTSIWVQLADINSTDQTDSIFLKIQCVW